MKKILFALTFIMVGIAQASNDDVHFKAGFSAFRDKNYAASKKEFEISSGNGNSNAQAVLGALYYNGLGVRQNYSTAKEWFGKACDNGDQSGCDAYKRLNERGY